MVCSNSTNGERADSLPKIGQKLYSLRQQDSPHSLKHPGVVDALPNLRNLWRGRKKKRDTYATHKHITYTRFLHSTPPDSVLLAHQLIIYIFKLYEITN